MAGNNAYTHGGTTEITAQSVIVPPSTVSTDSTASSIKGAPHGMIFEQRNTTPIYSNGRF